MITRIKADKQLLYVVRNLETSSTLSNSQKYLHPRCILKAPYPS